MTEHKTDISLRQAAIVSGTAILIMAIAAVVATDVTIGRFYVADDAAATTNNILASEMLYRFGIFSWLIILICDLIAAWGLYIYLKPVNNSLSLLMAWCRLLYTAILGTALVQLMDVLPLINTESHLAALGTEQLQAQILLSIKGFYDRWSIGLLVFSIHILLLGYLIIRSGYVPTFWGVLLILAFVGYLVTNLMDLLLPDYEEVILFLGWIFILPMLSEVGVGFWLLIKGVKVPDPQTN